MINLFWLKTTTKRSNAKGKSLLAKKHVIHKRNMLIFMAIFAVVGTSLLVISRAATSPIAFEAENAALSAGATNIANTNASGGRVLAFAGASTPNPVPTPTPGTVGGIYGPGIGYDSKANINIGPAGQKVAIKFRASTTSALNSVRWVQRGGPVYSNGNGGTTSLSIQTDDGAGHPSGTSLGSGSITTGNPSGNWETYSPVNISAAPILTAGKFYYIVFTNPSTANNISINFVYVFNQITPRQAAFSDSDFGVMDTTGSWGGVEGRYTPVVDIAYANGIHDGNSYYEAMIANYATISGSSNMAREHFTVSGGNRTVKSASVRVRRSNGSSPLVLTLETSTGAAVESVTVPASNIPVSAPGVDTSGAVWVMANFSSPHILTNGSSYNLRLSTASGTTYTTFPVRPGTDKGLASYAFPDGSGQSTTNGSTWTDLYLYSHEDLQFYFSL